MKAVFLFRHDLRVQDHPALNHAIQESKSLAFAIKKPSDFELWGNWRQKFWLESAQELKSNLMESGHQLFLVSSDELFEDFDRVFLTKEYAYDEEMEEKEFHECVSVQAQELYENLNAQKLPNQFTPFRKFLEKNEIPLPPFPLPDLAQVKACHSLKSRSLIWPQIPQQDFHPHTGFPFLGGQTTGKDRLSDYFFESQNVLTYKKTRNQMYGTEGSTKLSAWLSVGALSSRQIHAELKRFEMAHRANDSTYWVFFELLWREFFRMMGKRYGQRLFLPQGIKSAAPACDPSPDRLASWRLGTTGHALVDACQRELVQTGFMSNRGRQISASYFLNELNQDWRQGANFFEHHLVDYDVYSNWGNWMSLAGVGFDPRGKRWFNPEKQASQYDHDHHYRKIWSA